MHSRGLRAGFLVLLYGAGVASACTVPVFRYALERWPADVHRVTMASDRVPAEAAVLDPGDANLWIERVDTNREAAVTVAFPTAETLWYEGGWDDGLLARLSDSPLRRKVAHDLLTGATAVFVLLESSNAASNAVLEAMVGERLAALVDEIELPDQPDYEDAADRWAGAGAGQSLSELPLRISFPLYRLARSNESERFFTAQLDALMDGAADPADGVVAVIFGRGRVIPLPAAAVTDEFIDEVCWFLCSPCSCRVKAMNPGVDLLMTANWDEGIYSYPEATTALLPDRQTFSLGGTVDVELAVDSAEPPDVPAGTEPCGGEPSASSALLALGVAVVVIAGISLVLFKKGMLRGGGRRIDEKCADVVAAARRSVCRVREAFATALRDRRRP